MNDDIADLILDGVIKCPEAYATNNGELVAIIWTAMTIQAVGLDMPEAPRLSREKVFPGPQMISPRFPNMPMGKFADKLEEWIIEYRKLISEDATVV